MGQRCGVSGLGDISQLNPGGQSRVPLGSCVCRDVDIRGCPADVDEQEAAFQQLVERGVDATGATIRWVREAPDGCEVSFVNGLHVPHGGVYTGQVRRDGQPQGSGTQRWPDGTAYTGNWSAGAAHGHGRLSKADGSGFDGIWQEGRKHGAGVEWLPDESEYRGEFSDGMKHGAGEFRWKGGARYAGEFFEDNLHGEGAFYWPDGRCFRGQWVRSQMHGHGRFDWPDGKSFEGKYEADRKHGPGVFVWPDGSKSVGMWVSGKQHGLGTHVAASGLARRGRWKGGVLDHWLEPPPSLAAAPVGDDADFQAQYGTSDGDGLRAETKCAIGRDSPSTPSGEVSI